jgi:Golgi nucleoside diphosphatase
LRKNKAALSIKPLLDKALDVIPTNHHKVTRLTLKATAGLRLISEEIANQILENVKLVVFIYKKIIVITALILFAIT